MKKLFLIAPLLLLCVAATIRLAPLTVDWGKPVNIELNRVNSGDKIQLGLRSDGIVIWRQIIPAKAPTTNSPAEAAESDLQWWFNTSATNVIAFP